MLTDKSKREIYNKILEKLLYLEIKPGETINECELAQSFGVSRTPVREALLLLADEKFINIYPRKGTYASKVDFHYVSEMVYLLEKTESGIFSDFAIRKPRIREKVKKELFLELYAAKNRNTDEFMKSEYNFYKALFAVSGHVAIWEHVKTIMLHCIRLCMIGQYITTGDLLEAYNENKEIVVCIEKGKTDELKKIIKGHNDFYISQYLMKIIDDHSEYFENTGKTGDIEIS